MNLGLSEKGGGYQLASETEMQVLEQQIALYQAAIKPYAETVAGFTALFLSKLGEGMARGRTRAIVTLLTVAAVAEYYLTACTSKPPVLPAPTEGDVTVVAPPTQEAAVVLSTATNTPELPLPVVEIPSLPAIPSILEPLIQAGGRVDFQTGIAYDTQGVPTYSLKEGEWVEIIPEPTEISFQNANGETVITMPQVFSLQQALDLIPKDQTIWNDVHAGDRTTDQDWAMLDLIKTLSGHPDPWVPGTFGKPTVRDATDPMQSIEVGVAPATDHGTFISWYLAEPDAEGYTRHRMYIDMDPQDVLFELTSYHFDILGTD